MRGACFILGGLAAAACGRVDFVGHDGRTIDVSADATTGAQLSCVGLASTCGPAGTSSCCDSPLVSGGTFYLGYDVANDASYKDMTHPATVGDFRLDAYPVTVGRFRAFVAAGLGTQQAPPSSGVGARTLGGVADQGGWDPAWNASLPADPPSLITMLDCGVPYQSWTDTPAASEALPIDCITWFEAMAFCTWDGGFLPSEAEWMYAAAGGTDQRAFPWSTPASSLTIDCTYADYDASTGYCVTGANGGVDRVGSESPAGDGKWGHADLGGNVWEWTLDYDGGGYLLPCDDCANLTPAPNRVFHGGDFHALLQSLRVAHRASDVPAAAYVGARCARAP